MEYEGGQEGEGEGKKRGQVEHHARRRATITILNCLENELHDIVVGLTSKELTVLLWWKGVPTTKMGNMVEKCVLSEKLVEEGDREDKAIILAV